MHYCGLFPVSFHTVRMPKLEYIQISGKCLSSFQTFNKPNISENRTKCPEPEVFGFQGLYCMISGHFELVDLVCYVFFEVIFCFPQIWFYFISSGFIHFIVPVCLWMSILGPFPMVCRDRVQTLLIYIIWSPLRGIRRYLTLWYVYLYQSGKFICKIIPGFHQV